MILNLINSKVYIGQSIDIYARWASHIHEAKTSNKPLYKSMRKYGIENFKFIILKETTKNELNVFEKCYISSYSSYDKEFGYNLTLGGEGATGADFRGEKNSRAKLTEKDVIFIRIAYANKEEKLDVYEKFKNIISKSTFDSVWSGETWKSIMPEVYTAENRKIQKRSARAEEHRINAAAMARRVVSDKDVLFIRDEKNKGILTRKEVSDMLPHIKQSTVWDIWAGRGYKHIQSSLPNNNIKGKQINHAPKKEKSSASKLTESLVMEMRKRKMNGERACTVYKELFDGIITSKYFYSVWSGKRWSDVVCEGEI